MRLWLMERVAIGRPRRPGYVVRHARVTVDYFDKDGEKASGKTQKGWAIVVQHEIDHIQRYHGYSQD